MTAAEYRALIAGKAKKATKPKQAAVVSSMPSNCVVIEIAYGLCTVTHIIPAANLDVIAQIEAEKASVAQSTQKT